MNFFIASISTKLKHYFMKASILLAIIIIFNNLTLFSIFFVHLLKGFEKGGPIFLTIIWVVQYFFPELDLALDKQ